MPSKSFVISEIPDPRFGPFRAAAGGDVRRACFTSAEQVLRSVAAMPVEGGGFLEIRTRYTPTDNPRRYQERLQICVTIGASTEQDLQSLLTAVRCGPLSRFYSFEQEESTAPPRIQNGFVCDILRRSWMTRPLVRQDRNPHVPQSYFAVVPFVPELDNDGQMLDRVLGGLGEPVEIRIAVAAYEASRLIDAHAAYLHQIESINRARGDEEPDSTLDEDFFGDSDKWSALAHRSHLKPFHHRDPLADEQLRLHRRLQESLYEPQVTFHLRVMACSPAIARLIGSIVGASMFREGGFTLVTRTAKQAGEQKEGVDPCPLELVLPRRMDSSSYASLLPLVHVAPVGELLGAIRLPVSGASSPCCTRRNTDPAPPPENSSCLIVGRDLEVWTVDERGGLDQILSLETLAKHLFISGLSGSGKTTFMIDLMIQLHERGIPFLVFETAKREYRALKRFCEHPDPRVRALAKSLQIYTLGAEGLSPLRFNPLQPMTGVSTEEHVEHLMTMFQASTPMSGPLPALFREGLLDLLRTLKKDDEEPVLADLRTAIERCLAAKQYSAETNSDIRAALDVRLGLLTEGLTGRIFQSPNSSPAIKDIVSGYTIIELDRLPREGKCAHFFGLCNAIRRYLRNVPHSGGLRFIGIVEEAHNVVGTITEARPSEEAADPRAYASESAATALAEDRAIGIGHVFVDQLSSAVAPQVIKNTGTKVAFRQVAMDDRETLGGSMLCGDAEQQELARLAPGEAYFFTEGQFRPRRIRTRNLHKSMPDLSRPCGDEELLSLIQNDSWRIGAERKRRDAELKRLGNILNRFDSRRWVVGKHLLALRTQSRASPGSESLTCARPTRDTTLGTLPVVKRLRNEILTAFDVLQRREIPRLLGDLPPADSVMREWWDALRRRWEAVIKPDTRAWLDRVGRWIQVNFAN